MFRWVLLINETIKTGHHPSHLWLKIIFKNQRGAEIEIIIKVLVFL